MLCVVSDTHGTDSHRLTGRTLDAVRKANIVIHAGDFTTEVVLDAFEAECRELRAVHGNNDTPAVCDRLPTERTIEFEGMHIALTHGDGRDDTELGLFGREERADLVIFGHSHRPEFVDTGELGLLNPGSHADPRWHRPAHAELDINEKTVRGRLHSPDGELIEEFRVQT